MERAGLLDFSDGFLKGLGVDNKGNLPLVPTGPAIVLTIVPSIVATGPGQRQVSIPIKTRN